MTTVGDLLAEFKEKPKAGQEPPVLTLTERKGFVRQTDRFNKRLATDDISGYKIVRRNDIAFNPYLLWAGAVAQNTIVDEGVISPLYPTFRVRDGHDPRYVARILLSPQLIRAYDSIAFGSVPRRRRSSVKDFLSLSVANIPPVEDQRRIARILDQADTIRVKRRQVLAHLDSLTGSLFYEMFGDAAQTRPLGELVDEFRYGTSSKATTHGDPVLRIPNVVSGRIDVREIKKVSVTPTERERLRLQTGDVLLVRSNGNSENVGRCAAFDSSYFAESDFADDRFVYASYLIRARPRAEILDGKFLAEFLASPDGRRLLKERARTSAGQYNVNTASLATIPVPVATIESQKEFATRLDEVNAQRALVRRALDADNELFASLQARAFRGEL